MFKPQDRVEKIFGGQMGEVTRVYADGTLWAIFNGEDEELFSKPEGKLKLFQRPHDHELRPAPEKSKQEPLTNPIHRMTPLPDRIIHV